MWAARTVVVLPVAEPHADSAAAAAAASAEPQAPLPHATTRSHSDKGSDADDSATSVTAAPGDTATVCEADVLSETTAATSRCGACSCAPGGDAGVVDDASTRHDEAVAAAGVSRVEAGEALLLELHKMHYGLSQDGPYIGSRMRDRPANWQVDTRARRAIVRVPVPEMPYTAAETSFRRLPRDVRLPNEYELRALYPLTTSLTLSEGHADCVDVNAVDLDAPPIPLPFSILAPPDWDVTRPHPYMVVLSDYHGDARDFEDVCANLFERPLHRQLMCEQGWVVFAPHLPMRYSFTVPIEGVVARFCDWVCAHYAVEHGLVHLFGKGLGAYTALRTVLEHKAVAASVTALLGRNGSPLRQHQQPFKLAPNYNGVHSLVYVPGLLRKQDYYYTFKLILDVTRVRPPLRNIHFADVLDHQLYYAINPYELWNYMRYFRQHSVTRHVSESGHHV